MQADVAVGLDLHLPAALSSTAGRRGDDRVGRLLAGRLGNRGGIPRLLRGDPAGKSLMGPLGVVDELEGVDLFLELGDRRGQRLLVEPAEQGLVEAFVLALGGSACRDTGINGIVPRHQASRAAADPGHSPRGSVTTKNPRSVTDVLMQNRHLCPAT